MDKLRFFSLRLGETGPVQLSSPVPFYLTYRECPQVVGILLSRGLQPPQAYADVATQAKRMRLRVDAVPTNTIRALRSLLAFVLSQLDFSPQVLPFPQNTSKSWPFRPGAFYRHVLGLPCWVSRALLSLPPRYGGPGCPHLPLRTACRLPLTYTQATCSRSFLAPVSARYLSSTSAARQ